MDKGLGKRLFNFSVKTIKYCKKFNYSIENKIIINQLVKSATSSGANYEEAQAGSSRADFKNKVNIALKEMRESNYWLRLIKEIENNSDELNNLISESNELMKILGSITNKVSK